MKLTLKDKEFLEALKRVTESKELWVELRPGKPSYMVLRGTYGDKIHQTFKMTRQGVRWRFQRLLGDIYISAFESILLIEKTLGTQLREHAMRISRERYELRQQITESGFQSAGSLIPRRQEPDKPANGAGVQMTRELPAETAVSRP